jgi:DNA-binding response OmpR family regulator
MAILKAPFILVVNENRPVRNLLQTILKHAGYGVLAVATENEALRLMRHGDSGIRLLIVDRNGASTPHLTGPDRPGEDAKVLFLTAFRTLPERITDALEQPETGFLAKPFSPKALLNLVEALIGPPEESCVAGPWRATQSDQSDRNDQSDWTLAEAPTAFRDQG